VAATGAAQQTALQATEEANVSETKRAVRVSLPILLGQRIGGLHQEIATATFPDGTKVEVSAGFGLGHTQIYVSVGDRRVLAVDGAPLLKALIDTAVQIERRERE
jgi:hypothetical protein